MNITLRSKASSFLLAIIGTVLSGTIAAFIIIMIYANFQLAAAGTLSPVEDSSARAHRPVEKDRCRFQ